MAGERWLEEVKWCSCRFAMMCKIKETHWIIYLIYGEREVAPMDCQIPYEISSSIVMCSC